MADKKHSLIVMPSWLLAFRKFRAGGAKVLEDAKEHVHAAKDHEERREKEIQIELVKDLKKIENLKCMAKFLKISFTILSVATVLVSIALIGVSTVSAVAASAMDAQEDSGRVVGLVVLSVTAATAIAIAIYAQIATCSTKIRPIFVATVVLTILALLQAIIAGAAVRVTPKDAHLIEQSLLESFQLARQHSPRHVKMWATTQYTLHCCGYRDAYDYRDNNLLPPDVPISCCPTYDPERSEVVQEKERETCKTRHEYYDNGCSADVLVFITTTAQWVFHVSIGLVCLEFVTALFGGLLVNNRKAAAVALEKEKKDENDEYEANEK